MSKNMIIALIAAVIVLVGGAVAYMAMKKDTTNNTTQTSQDENNTGEASFAYQDACKVFTKEAIATALGGEYLDGEDDVSSFSADSLEGPACKYDQVNDGSTAGMTAALGFSVGINNYNNNANAAAFMNDLRNPQSAEAQEALGEATDVLDVGDQAFFPRINSTNSIYEKTEALYILKGNQVLVLNVVRLDGLDRETARTGLITLAQGL